MNTEKLTHVATFQTLILLKYKYQSWYLYQLSVIWYFQNRNINCATNSTFSKFRFFLFSWVVFSSDAKSNKAKKYFFSQKKIEKMKIHVKTGSVYPIPVLTSPERYIKTGRLLHFTYWEKFFQKVFRSGFLIGTQSEKKFSELLHQTGTEKIFFLFTSKE